MKYITTFQNIVFTSLILIIGFSTNVTFAQDAASKKTELAEELITLMRLNKSIEVVLEEKIKMEEEANPDLPEEKKAAIRREAEKLYNLDAIKKVWVQIYGEIFSEEELRGMIAFFKGPIGKRWIDTQPEVQMKTMRKMQEFMRDADAKLHIQQ